MRLTRPASSAVMSHERIAPMLAEIARANAVPRSDGESEANRAPIRAATSAADTVVRNSRARNVRRLIGSRARSTRAGAFRFGSDHLLHEVQHLDRQGKNDRGVLLGGNLGERLQVPKRDRKRLRRDDGRSLRELF